MTEPTAIDVLRKVRALRLGCGVEDCTEKGCVAFRLVRDFLKENNQEKTRMSLFESGDFTLHSGRRGLWKIECDALTDEDWATIAVMLHEILPPFGPVEGVPRGGLKLAMALERFSIPGRPLLIVDDVLTTGASLAEHRRDRLAIGAVVFARATPPDWVYTLFQKTPSFCEAPA